MRRMADAEKQVEKSPIFLDLSAEIGILFALI